MAFEGASGFEYGFDSQGVENLLAEIRGVVITQAADDAIKELSQIKTACNENWQGESREVFLKRLEEDANAFSNSLKELYNAFEKEIMNAAFNFNNFDKNLFN